MTLDEWLRERGRGEAARIVRDARVSFESVRNAAEGRLKRRDIARRISEATDGAVSVDSMLDESEASSGLASTAA